MKVWLKVCGLTDTRAVDAALSAGVDAVGFVFAASPRQVSIERACALKRHVNGRASVVAVMRRPTQHEVDQVLTALQPDFLQTDFEDLVDLELATDVSVLPVLRGTGRPDPLPDRVLFEGQVSGSGELSDWSQARALTAQTQVILAGGLTPGNVAAAIDAVKPFGVDVSSGVESTRGTKSIEKIHAFAEAVHTASAQL